MKKSSEKKKTLPEVGIKSPHDNDVLCGRGVTTNKHAGNEKFRNLVNCNKELYVSSTKKEKMNISRSIVVAVRSLQPPGRFLEKDSAKGCWLDIGDKKAVEKTSQALRDGAASLRKQMSEDLSDPLFLKAVFDDTDMDLEDSFGFSKNNGTLGDNKKGHRRAKSLPDQHLSSSKPVKRHRSLEPLGQESFHGSWPPPQHSIDPLPPTADSYSADLYDPDFLNAVLDMDVNEDKGEEQKTMDDNEDFGSNTFDAHMPAFHIESSSHEMMNFVQQDDFGFELLPSPITTPDMPTRKSNELLACKSPVSAQAGPYYRQYFEPRPASSSSVEVIYRGRHSQEMRW